MPPSGVPPTPNARRRFLGATAVTAGAVWSAPSILSVSGASAVSGIDGTGGPAPRPAGGTSLCDQYGKDAIFGLVFEFTGLSCDQITYPQDAGKGSCTDPTVGGPAGYDSVHVVASDGSGAFLRQTVALGQLFTLAPAGGGGLGNFDGNTVTVDLFDSSDPSATLLQRLAIHVSCSAPLVIGGDYGAARLVDLVQDPNLCTGSKPYGMTVQYTGLACGLAEHHQTADKTKCQGDPSGASVVDIAVHEGGFNLTPDPKKRFFSVSGVRAGDIFEISRYDANGVAKEFPADVTVQVSDATGVLQTFAFKGDCGQPILPNDQFGSIEVLQLRDVPDPDGDPDLCDGDVFAVAMTYNGLGCDAADNSQDPSKAECVGDPAGATDVTLRVFDAAPDFSKPIDLSGKVPFFTATGVGLGQQVQITNYDADGISRKFPNNVTVQVTDAGGAVLQTFEFHASCSQPIRRNDQFGSLRVDDLTNTALASTAGPSSTDLCRGKVLAFDVTFTGESARTPRTTPRMRRRPRVSTTTAAPGLRPRSTSRSTRRVR